MNPVWHSHLKLPWVLTQTCWQSSRWALHSSKSKQRRKLKLIQLMWRFKETTLDYLNNWVVFFEIWMYLCLLFLLMCTIQSCSNGYFLFPQLLLNARKQRFRVEAWVENFYIFTVFCPLIPRIVRKCLFYCLKPFDVSSFFHHRLRKRQL